MNFNHTLSEIRMWKSAFLLFVFIGLGFTSKFDAYNINDDLGYNIMDNDDGIDSNFLDVDETTTIDNSQQVSSTQQLQIDEPNFEYFRFRNLTILAGSTAYLKCYVKNIGNKTVSWVRHRDINLLTVGTTSYTSDIRFQSIHDADSDEWILKIRYAQVRDSGAFECQISTTPPKGYPIYLNVVEPQTTIIGEPDIFVNFGSTINLTCIVKNSPESPFAMFWTHNNVEVNYDSERGGISVITEKSEVTISYLLIQRARSSDTGIYTCSPSNANSKSVNVHITAGSNPEAMHGCGMKNHTLKSFYLSTIVVIILYVKKFITQSINSIS